MSDSALHAGLSRRQVGAALLGQAALLGLAPYARAATPAPYRIDVHHHLVPPAYLAAKRDVLVGEAPTAPQFINWTPESALREMDENSIAASVLSLSSPGVWFGDIAETRRLTRICNEYGAEVVAAHPKRFGMMAVLPLPDIDASLSEIDYAFSTLKVDGVGVLSSYGDKWLGDPVFAPIFEELDRRRAIVYVHPRSAECCSARVLDISPSTVEFLFDTTRAIMSLMVGGVLAHRQNVKFIFSHGGGAMPMVSDRVINSLKRPAWRAQMPDGPEAALRKIYVDTASAANAIGYRAAAAMLPKDHVLFGTDVPYYPASRTVQQLDGLGLSRSEARAVYRDNALRLFPRFA